MVSSFRGTTFFSFHTVFYGTFRRVCVSFSIIWPTVDMLSELSRREKAANIKPDPVIDVFMKVRNKATVHC